MDLQYTAEEKAFRAELREWLADVLPTLGSEPDREDKGDGSPGHPPACRAGGEEHEQARSSRHQVARVHRDAQRDVDQKRDGNHHPKWNQ